MYGSIIKNERLAKGMTQADLATSVGTTQGTIGKYERGELQPDIAMSIKLANFFKCSIDYLYGREDESGIIMQDPDSVYLTSDQKALINGYESLSPAGQAKVRGYIEGLKSAPEFVQTNRPIKL